VLKDLTNHKFTVDLFLKHLLILSLTHNPSNLWEQVRFAIECGNHSQWECMLYRGKRKSFGLLNRQVIKSSTCLRNLEYLNPALNRPRTELKSI